MFDKNFAPQIAYLPAQDRDLIRRAYLFAKNSHQGQKRTSGEPYITHPLAVATQLSKMRFDGQMISAAFLHDTVEDTPVTLKQIQRKFGKDIAGLVDGITKLSRVRLNKTWFGLGPIKKEKLPELIRQIETLKKMFLAMSRDIRVVIIKIIDRLHNMQTIKFLPVEKQIRIASETLQIFAPLASRLGMGEIKGQLEDLAFLIIYPKESQELEKQVKHERMRRKKIVDKNIRALYRLFAKKKFQPISLHGRVKHRWSLYRKLLRYDNDLSKIYDLIAIRVIVENIDECYGALGLIHERWRPLPGRIKDYIALPKPNGYSSLHTTVFGPGGNIIEIQIRTQLMHEQAEYGIAAHWQYKEPTEQAPRYSLFRQRKWASFPKQASGYSPSWNKENTKISQYLRKIFPENEKGIKWLKDLVRVQKAIKDPQELAKTLKLDFFSDRIFVFTPAGDVKDLPAGASPIDFAYSVHSELGHHYGGARVNGKIAASNFCLKNGDICEIIKNKKGQPKPDWLAVVKTSNARQKIKRAIKEK
ncbi:MAG: (p)ppGpp synthetase, RelA/SpoT family [Candidatus Berkelbacteria bacterium Licking1014_7]|uniref:(P)ppGpp synthetase, RelA/SpoT family n=1 Tax=Candidatus Berkelbacteria bacterium Licking1014_7 TaxID=2017147 RepID=A0A554LJC1_9BACT|nr:MAG: (p)ppGpp synthetase, RelA/SpoT family [Candidatus Berkelbacteria bacterium Licking1014_7]